MVIGGLFPLFLCKTKLARKCFKVIAISVEFSMKYMNTLEGRVERKVAHALPSKFAVVFDEWSSLQTNFVCVFALLHYRDSCEYSSALLGFSPFQDKFLMDASSHIEFFMFILSLFDKNKNMENVTCLTGDKCNTNKAVADMLGKPLIIWCSQRLNMAV